MSELDLLQLGDASVPARVLATASRLPEVEAVVDGGARVTYERLAGQVVAATSAVIAGGVQHGDRVAVWAPNSAAWIVAAVGAMGAGAAVVPLSTRFRGAEAGWVLRTSGARLLVTDRGFLGHDFLAMLADWQAASGEELPDLESVVVLDAALHGDTEWDDFVRAGGVVPTSVALEHIRSIGADDLCDVLFTSGTTGRPKGVMSTHGQVLEHYDSWASIVGLGEGDRQLVVTPFSHATGFKAGWLATLLRGGTVLPMSTFDPRSVLDLVQRERVTFLQGPPTLLQDLLDVVEGQQYDVSSLRTTVTGAAAIPVGLISRLRQVGLFEEIFTGYGLTEANGPASISRRGDDVETVARFSGRAMPNTEVKIVTSDREAPRGEPGEIMVRGYHVMRGYLDDVAATEDAIDRDGWLRTGDVGTMNDRGYLAITGRIKEMFIVGGFNVYPSEVEMALCEYEGISDVAVIGVHDGRLGEVGMAFVVPEPGSTFSADDFVAWARERVSNYKVPRHVHLVEGVPRNGMGKIDRNELRSMAVTLEQD